jgi:hypothetical protein|tara:strand:+ start:453 stop:950 length:498 start_codon:yes stop_codon:yes gene_type:complete
MRDIRHDLRERLEDVSSKRSDLELELKSLKDRELHLNALLTQEGLFLDGPDSPDSRLQNEQPLQDEQTLTDAIRTILGGGSPLSLEELKTRLENSPLLAETSSPGRSIHFSLVGMSRLGRAHRAEDGKWSIRPEPSSPADVDTMKTGNKKARRNRAPGLFTKQAK